MLALRRHERPIRREEVCPAAEPEGMQQEERFGRADRLERLHSRRLGQFRNADAVAARRAHTTFVARVRQIGVRVLVCCQQIGANAVMRSTAGMLVCAVFRAARVRVMIGARRLRLVMGAEPAEKHGRRGNPLQRDRSNHQPKEQAPQTHDEF